MSGLAPLLAGQRPAGVYRWRAAFDAADLAVVVEAAGWSLRCVDGVTAQTKAEFLAAVGRALQFPDTYGQNLDALADLLDDLPGPTVLLWDAWNLLAVTEPRTFATLVRLFGDRCADPVRPPFTVLLRGHAPEGAPAVPVLD